MNTKVQSLLLVLVLLSSMFSDSEGYFPARVGRKSSIQGADGSEDAFMGTRVTRDQVSDNLVQYDYISLPVTDEEQQCGSPVNKQITYLLTYCKSITTNGLHVD
ncbi:unnamed protein product [Porites evermanni]|uniref:Uncharacterized protein n=1 Tax=Porites evermanni TaxID=104178 RepID=A0ABN8PPE5_9CNID|nr:unnamed protein product [Porites evermanni]